MTLPARPVPTLTEKAQADLEKRLAREAAALRANLLRRKAQVRNRAVKAPEDQDMPVTPAETSTP
ncbi:hypothetical protein ACFFGF_07680 [Asaia lannensis]|uniref:Transposase n=1 Tax=Asaia lannensis NBRC 102526 TaxID=1307926 RepID=A0ABT1CKW8_9PROT|nr:hypothetical protein [Asaia lannensis]MCO6160899.1 hypothetical protein [Asaia lannensis NBRC 102526]GBR01561.1 hypothetical protein AA102526_2549 [Asaia lannensis NBRC 102526]